MYRKRILCFIYCVCLLISTTGCNSNKVPFNIASYIDIVESGYDGYGTMTVQFNYEKLYSDFKTQFIKSELDTEQLKQCVYVEPIPNNTLRNGQTVSIAIKTDTKNVNIEKITKESFNITLSHTVSKLTPCIPYNPFEDLKITSSGFDGTGTIYPHIEHYGLDASWEWPITVSDNNGSLSNGDIVQLTIDVNEQEVERKYGVDIQCLTTDYQVTTLISYLKSSSDLQKISEDNLKALNKVIEDWVISGENDENPYNRTRTYKFETAVLLTKENDSRICFIYHIEDDYVPSGYYVYISPNYTVLVDNENNTLISGDKRALSSSFAKYDKETVRYTEKWGWGQDYERQGFMYNDVPYAGKATLEDMITYLRTWYAGYPTMHQLSN